MPTEEEWIKHKKGWESGGGSLRGYCREHELSYDQFRYKIKRINAGKIIDRAITKDAFIPVTIAKSSVTADSDIYCTINYPNGIKVTVNKLEVLSRLHLG